MRVLFITAELSPYIRVGNLADISSFIVSNLNDITTISPMYNVMDRSKFQKLDEKITISFDNREFEFDIYKDGNSLFLYNDIFEQPYQDSPFLYTLFSFAVLKIAKNYDVIHINDWHFALLSHLIKLDNSIKSKVIFSVYNLLYQGIYEFNQFPNIVNLDLGEFFGKLNLFKLALLSADIVTFNSKNYLDYAIESDLFALAGLLKTNLHKIEFVNSVVNFDLYDTQNDVDLYHNYSAKDFSNKKLNKKDLLKNLKQTGVNKPLFGVIGIYDYSMDILISMFESFRDFDFNIIILLEQKSEILKNFVGRYENIFIIDSYSLETAKKLYAGSDFFISLSEISQINELIASKYGTIPIIRDDSYISDFIQESQTIQGVKIKALDRYSILEAICRAFFLFSNKSKFLQISIENMYKNSAVSNYFDIYKKSLE